MNASFFFIALALLFAAVIGVATTSIGMQALDRKDDQSVAYKAQNATSYSFLIFNLVSAIFGMLCAVFGIYSAVRFS
jgi:hypothetical protein